MINYIWFILIFLGILVAIFTGNGAEISTTIVGSADSTVKFIIGLVGIMCFWCGVMKIAEKSGLTQKLARLMKPLLKFLFKDAGKDEKALGAIVMNLTANMMGLSNAATPFGIKAMEEMDRLNPNKGRASNDMALFLVMNAACIQLVPSTIISIRAAAGSSNPGAIILPAILSTASAVIVGVICCKILQRYF
ncbi:MAG: nucleoside recognition domain-containing protein [Clostridium sp.]|uniref:nucleoside recognition domain-containing protein n=1 Tax=Clostridium sp. TaxID=1506 RepID=UPI0028FF9EDA|nr:nucleoside recognition domain-containing protein [Clostridium sp.]MDU1978817.1 nucleoside recognition domain-containing protein [Clostridium sp.]MDU1994247.1 nucleoside recognition domain-containing protein [Clostridium sp.]MDU6048835.1 nucleoside recognition domain-containing protein [Clostridium sp.]MDU6222310.1 nucleoside recognition domain-containing protein [Clostridium sp.]MDU6272420.1 nucleoside recognition domain-containing protein [Clostridium sp.]